MKPSRFTPLLVLFVLVLVCGSFFGVCATGPVDLDCVWSGSGMVLDGEMTSEDEWGEASPVDVVVGYYDTGAPYTMRVWAQNDEKYLYLLYRVQYAEVEDGSAEGGILYFWPEYHPVAGWEHSDAGSYVVDTRYGGYSDDLYGWDETQFYDDVEADPPGRDNCEGGGRHDGSYYWFELRKPLDSGDGYDWVFEHGETYGWDEGTPGRSDALMVVFFPFDLGVEEGQNVYYSGYIRLTIASKPVSEITGGGGLTLSLETATGVITVVGAGVAVVSWMNRTRSVGRRKKILFERFMEGIDGIYSDFKMNAHRRESDLHKLNNDVLSEFKQGLLDEEQYNILYQRIEDIMKEINQQKNEGKT